MKKQHNKIINEYLSLGYILDSVKPDMISNLLINSESKHDYSVTGLSKKFDDLFDELYDSTKTGRHLVPLSGGWDSRAILAGLLERTDSSKIETITYGAPGQLDFEIGIKIAKFSGVKYHKIDLTQVKFSWEALLNSVKKSPWTFVPDGFFNQTAIDKVLKDSDTVWSGFLGDPLTGSHLNIFSHEGEFSKEVFLNKQQRASSCDLKDPEHQLMIPRQFKPDNNGIRIEDYMDIGLRQINCIAPIVLFNNMQDIGVNNEYNSAQIIAPFLNKKCMSYWLTAPDKVRQGQKLYLDMLFAKYPKLFALPGKANMGVHRNERLRYTTAKINYILRVKIQKNLPKLGIRTKINLNYIDYDEMYRKRKDYKETLITAFDYLKSNEIALWLNYDKLWKEHMRNQKDYGDAFNVLVGLAANLKVSEDDNNLFG